MPNFKPVTHPDAVNRCASVMQPSLRKDAALVTCAFIGVTGTLLMRQGFEVIIIGTSLETTVYDADLVGELLEFAKYLSSEAEVATTVREYFAFLSKDKAARDA